MLKSKKNCSDSVKLIFSHVFLKNNKILTKLTAIQKPKYSYYILMTLQTTKTALLRGPKNSRYGYNFRGGADPIFTQRLSNGCWQFQSPNFLSAFLKSPECFTYGWDGMDGIQKVSFNFFYTLRKYIVCLYFIYTQKFSPRSLWVSKFDVKFGTVVITLKMTLCTCVF